MTPWAFLVTALATGTTSRTSNTSPWSPAAWRIQLDIGREVGTTMPEEWAASKNKLRGTYQRISNLFRENPVWNDDSIGGSLALVVHTAYHLGEIRQALCVLKK